MLIGTSTECRDMNEWILETHFRKGNRKSCMNQNSARQRYPSLTRHLSVSRKS